jgi:hypothetical protein
VTRRLYCLLLSVTLILTGCGLRDPYAQQPERRAATPSAAAPTAPPAVPLNAPAGSATDALARYATAWVNWSAATLSRQRETLMALAAGPLAVELRQDAAQAARSRLQEVSNAYSRGRYVGLIPEASGGAIVVTYEEVAPLGGSAQAAYHVYVARTAKSPNGLRVTQWQPATDG